MQPAQAPTQRSIENAPEAIQAATVGPASITSDTLVQSRLGVYAGLFHALRAKHPPTAAHVLRVALGCSTWSDWRRSQGHERDLLEVAALLHDVGKIGIPDRILQKPAQLDSQELLLMKMQGTVAAEMLRGSGASGELIDIVQLARADFGSAGERLPMAAKMLAIVDAFDSMTTDQVFRRALSRQRAMDELFSHAGSQFDPRLVQEFALMISQPKPDMEAFLADRWLAQFIPDAIPGFWTAEQPVSQWAVRNAMDTLFHRRLLDSLIDAAIYLDPEGRILHWNQMAERLTGHQAISLCDQRWTSKLMGLRRECGEEISPAQCPLRLALQTRAQVQSRLQVTHLDGRSFQVNFTAVPIVTAQGELTGVILLVRDASDQAVLEERVQSLNMIALQDSLTKVANRAELDQRLPGFLRDHLEKGQPGSLIICDIDHFKQINDNFGHQSGDEALVTFAGVLREISREGDLVARYGGEEFVVLCAGCDNQAATARAEEMRRAVEQFPVPSLNGTSLTASFGVTESQAGDTPATLLERADRALLTAKKMGRNRVVHLGSESDPLAPAEPTRVIWPKQKASWLSWLGSGQQAAIVETERLASVPYAIAVQKLEGFISDHRAEVLKTEPSQITLRIDGQKSEAGRRMGERSAVMIMEVTFTPVDYRSPRTNAYQVKTKLGIVIRAVRARDRRADALMGQARQLLASFNSYLMAQEITAEMQVAIAELR